MTVEYTKQFSKDLLKVKEESLKDDLFNTITALKTAETLNVLSNIKKLKGYQNAYRIGKYRLGFYFDGEVIKLARFATRENIYKIFP